MPGTVNELYEDLKALNLREELPGMVLSTSYEIIALVIIQKEDGLLSTGEKITPKYKEPAYAKKKYWQYNPLAGYGTPDGRLTGALDAGISVSVTDTEYDIESNVPYATSPQIEQYGPNLLRLSDQNIGVYCETTLLPVIHGFITDKTGLTFE